MDLQLNGKNALVCASSQGLGYATATSLAEEGTNLYLCSRDEAKLAKAAESISAKSPSIRIAYSQADLSDPSQVRQVADTASSKLGPLDIVVNNIGGPAVSSAKDTPIHVWQKGFEQLFLSSTQLSQLLIPTMAERGFGRILTITSISVVEPIDHLCVSTSMRAAVTAFCKTLSKEVAISGITVNTIMPGVIHTERVKHLRQKRAERMGTTLEEEMEKAKKSIPMGRLGKPEELADLITFLASPRASYITGMNFCVDGGLRNSW